MQAIFSRVGISGTRPTTADIVTHIKLPHVHTISSAAGFYCNLLQSQQIKCPAPNFPHFHYVRSAGNLLCSFLKSPPSLNFAVKYPALQFAQNSHSLDFKILLQLVCTLEVGGYRPWQGSLRVPEESYLMLLKVS